MIQSRKAKAMTSMVGNPTRRHGRGPSVVAAGRGAGRTWRAVVRAVVVVATILGAAMVSAPARAQPTSPRPAAEAAATGPLAGAKRDKIRRKLLALRAFRLTEELALDEASAARLFPLLAKYDPQLEQLTLDRMTLARQLQQGPTGAAADDLINRAVVNRRALLELEERRLADLRKVLTPQQTARLLVVLPEIETQLKRQIRQVVRKQGRSGLVDPFAPADGGDLGGNPYGPASTGRRERREAPAKAGRGRKANPFGPAKAGGGASAPAELDADADEW